MHTNHKHQLDLSQKGHTHVITIPVKTYTSTSTLQTLPLPAKMPPLTLHPPSSQKVTIVLN